MGAEASPSDTRLPVQPNDTNPEEHEQPSDTSANASQALNGFRDRARHVTPCMRFAILAVLLLVLLVSFASTHPLYSLMFAFLAILPAGIVANFILTELKDDAVSETFLVNQFLMGAIPLSILVVLVELIFGAILLVTIFSQELSHISQMLGDSVITNGTIPVNTTANANTTTTSGTSKLTSIRPDILKPVSIRLSVPIPVSIQLGVGGKTLPESMIDIAPLWKIILFLLLNAFLVAGFVEETGKWLVSQRYRKINSDPSNLELERTIGCRGVLAVCSMGALGFATVENLGYVVGLSATKAKGFPFALVALALLRGVLAFPVHVGAQFYVGVAAAQRYIFNDHSRVLFSLFVAIMLHGIFDAASLIVGLFVTEKWWPDWTMAIVLTFQLSVVALLMILCRGRYKALLERERIVLLPSDDV